MRTPLLNEQRDILVIGGYGEVGRRVAEQLEAVFPEQVVVAGRHPEGTEGRARRVDVEDPGSVEEALDGVRTVIVCVRQRGAHVVRAAVRRGLAYTSIAPPWMPWREVEPLHREAQRTGARIVPATGLEPGISSILARMGADRVGEVAAVETALLLSVGDSYGADSMAFILDEITQPYTVVLDGRARHARAFGDSALVTFPTPIGSRRAYAMPFRDQLYYPVTLGAKTAIARLALDPPWLGAAIAKLTKLGARALLKQGRAGEAMHTFIARLRRRYTGHNRFGLVVEVRGANGRVVRASLVGHNQAHATAAGASAFVQALHRGEVAEPGVWLGEQVIGPERFMARLAEHGLQPGMGGALRPVKHRASQRDEDATIGRA